MWMSSETATPAKNCTNETAGRKPLIEDVGLIWVFDKLRVTSLSGMGNAVLASLILRLGSGNASQQQFNESIPSRRTSSFFRS
jgi:hypothetical protein